LSDVFIDASYWLLERQAAMKAYEILIIVGVVALLLVPRMLRRSRRPKETTFQCARCATIAAHSNRTIEAWRAGRTKLFCTNCHAEWLRRQPAGSLPRSAARSGCLSVLIGVALLPLAWLALERFF
jgi:hypothetical protein